MARLRPLILRTMEISDPDPPILAEGLVLAMVLPAVVISGPDPVPADALILPLILPAITISDPDPAPEPQAPETDSEIVVEAALIEEIIMEALL